MIFAAIFPILWEGDAQADHGQKRLEQKFSKSGSSQCPNWNEQFIEQKSRLDSYKKNIERELQIANGGSLPKCQVKEVPKAKDPRINYREGFIDVSATEELTQLSKSLPRFRYQVLPPRIEQPAGKPLQTIFMLAGGPGNVFSERLTELQSNNYQVIVADHVGMGSNEISNIKSGIDDQFLGLDDYSKLIEQIIIKEKSAGMGDYVLQGNSFGSVVATVTGSKLSNVKNLKLRPHAVLLGGVAGFSDTKPKLSGKPINPIEWSPRIINGVLCILPQEDECFDDSILKIIEDSVLRTKIKENMLGQFKVFNQEKPTAIQSLIRDAFHWEAKKPPNAASFLKDYFSDSNIGALYCWYKREFDSVVFLNREQSPSKMASVTSLNCHMSQGLDPICRCFSKNQLYTSQFQIKPPTRIYYVNGNLDSQTPIEGARKHFESQENPNKSFLTVPDGGHSIYGVEGQKGVVSLATIQKAVFDATLSEFSK